MDATFVYMGYRGEDASRTRADSGRQSPWQSPSSTGAGSAASWDDGSRDYGHDNGYATTDGYGGYPREDSYAGYEDYGQRGGHGITGAYESSGYSAAGDYDAGNYGAPAGYDSGGYSHDYEGGGGYGARYEQVDGYGERGGYGQPVGYRDGGDGYDDRAYPGGFGSGPYEQPQTGGRHSADRDTGGHRETAYGGYGGSMGPGGSGGYPALGAPSGGHAALPGRHRDAGNDWYSGQPTAAGSGFADTGVHNFGPRGIDSYTTGPRDPVRGFPPAPGSPRPPRAELEAAAPQGLVHTGQQERYDDTRYDAYPGYDGQDDYDSRSGYGAADGYQASPGYDDYDEPQAFDTRGYDTDRGYDTYGTGPRRDLGRDYDEYGAEGDPYQDRYGDDGTGPRPGGGRGTRKKRGGKRSKRPLLLAVMAVVTVGVVAAVAYVYVLKPKQPTTPATAGPLPTSGPAASAATSACVKQLGEYCHIEMRTDDPVPLTLAELFPPAFTNETDHTSFNRIGTRLDKTCSNAVIGQDLISALKSDSCTQVLRASYVSAGNTIMGTIGVINLATTNEAHHAGKVVGANDFISPLSTKTGIGSKLGSGTGVVEAEFKGHYLILTWAEFANGKAPKTTAQDEQLEQFESDLVAGTANIDLSQRMVNGVKAAASS